MLGRFAKLLGLAAGIALLALGFLTLSHTPAPEATFVTLQGEKISTAELRGKVAIVDFWATDCPICRAEMPAMIETYNRYRGQGLEFIAVAMPYDPPNYVIAYSEKYRLPFKVALDPMGELVRRFGGVKFTPTTFVIDKRGDIVERIVGAADSAKLDALLEKKLKEAI